MRNKLILYFTSRELALNVFSAALLLLIFTVIGHFGPSEAIAQSTGCVQYMIPQVGPEIDGGQVTSNAAQTGGAGKLIPLNVNANDGVCFLTFYDSSDHSHDTATHCSVTQESIYTDDTSGQWYLRIVHYDDGKTWCRARCLTW